MNKKVYVYIVKHFFNENGTDYAAAIDNSEIRVFSSFEKAYFARKKEVENRLVNPNNISGTFLLDNGTIELRHADGWRDIFEIIEKNLF